MAASPATPADPDDLDALVVRAQRGNDEALEQLLARIRPLALRRCAKLLPYLADAEEAAQDALLNVSRHLDSYDPTRGTFLGWTTAIASNSARSTYRSLVRRSSEQPSDMKIESADPARVSVIAGCRLDLMDAIEALEQQHPATVEAFVLRDLGTLPYQEIADLTGTALGTVKARVHHARAFVRDRLGGAYR